MVKRFVFQVIALSICLLVVTDFIEQSWLTKVKEQTASLVANQLFERKNKMEVHRFLQAYQQNHDPFYEHRCGNNEIKNSNMDMEDLTYWQSVNSELELTTPGVGDANEYALRMYNRSIWFSGAYQLLTRSCFQVGDVIDFQFRVKLEGATTPCQPTLEDYLHCPLVILGSNYNGDDEVYHHQRIYDHNMNWTDDGSWNTFHVTYHMTEENVAMNVTALYAMIVGGEGDMIIDNVNIRLLPCYSNVVVNGDAETASIEPFMPVFEAWDNFRVVNSTQADIAEGNYSYVHINRTSTVAANGVLVGVSGQATNPSIDFRHCMAINSWWRFHAKVRLVSPGTNRSSIETCGEIPAEGKLGAICPYFAFVHRQYDDWQPSYIYLHDEQMMNSWDPHGWNTFDIQIPLTQEHMGPDKFEPTIWVIGGNNNDDFYVDDIQFYRLEKWESPTASPTVTDSPTAQPTQFCTQNWAEYGGGDWQFNDEAIPESVNDNGVYWWSSFGSKIGLETPGYGDVGHAISASNRGSWAHGIFFWHVDLNCVTSEETWRVAFKVKLHYQDSGLPVTTCNPAAKSLDCPIVRMLIKYADGRNWWLTLHDTNMIWPTDGIWAEYSVDFSLPESYYTPDMTKFAPIICGGPANTVMVLDDLRFQRLTLEKTPTAAPTETAVPTISPTVYCTKNSIRNHDFKIGNTDHWYGWDAHVSIHTPGYGTELYAAKVTNRRNHGGISQRFDPTCFEELSVWRVQFKAKLINATTGDGMGNCDPSIEDTYECPMARIVMRKNYGKFYQYEIRDDKMVWNPNNWSTFDVVWAPTGDVVSNDLTYAMVIISGGDEDATLVVDDIFVERLEKWETPTSFPSESPQPTAEVTDYCDGDNTRNPDAERGTAEHWSGWGTSVGVGEPGYGGSNYSLKVFDRPSWQHGIGQWFDPHCVVTNSTWRIRAKVKLYDQATGNPVTKEQCNPKNTLNNWCPMVRLLTAKPTINVTTETTDRRSLIDRFIRPRKLNEQRKLSPTQEFTMNVFRDTEMIWNDDGDWVDMNVYMQLTPENSGPEVNLFWPLLVGGPPNSVLELDDISIQRTDGTDAIYRTAYPHPKTCSSIGDPHIITFDGLLYDSHQFGWHTLFSSHGIVIEVEQTTFAGATVAFNRAWRVSQDGNIIGQGEHGVVPVDNVVKFYEPVMLLVHFVAVDVSEVPGYFGDHMYNIYVTSSEYDKTIFSQCNPNPVELVDETPEITADQETQDVASSLCANVTGMYKDTMYDACVKDLLIMTEMNAVNATPDTSSTSQNITNITNTTPTYDYIANVSDPMEVPLLQMYSQVLSVEQSIDIAVAQVDQPEDGSTEEQELALAYDIKVTSDTLTLEATESRTESTPLEVEDDDQSAGVEGDPLIVGVQKQKFEFEGKHDQWYANFASKKLQWNMKYYHFDTCAGDSSMYVTSMGFTIRKSNGGSPHKVLISVIDESQTFPGCDNGVCLSDGSLKIDVDGQTITNPGDYLLSNDLRIIAFNTYEACARKWYEYEEGIHRHDDLYDNAVVHRNLRHSSPRSFFSNSSIFDWFTRRSRTLLSSKTALQFIRDDRQFMVRPLECSPWLEARTEKDDLFLQSGGWSNVYIETNDARFQIQHRQISKTREELHGGSSYLAEDTIIEGIFFEGSQHTCQAHVLDGWVAHTSHSLNDDNWYGVLGETKKIKYNNNGSPVLYDRHSILVGSDEDYEVTDAFATEFTAKTLSDEIRRLENLMVSSKKQVHPVNGIQDGRIVVTNPWQGMAQK
mmetsp:Transcript_22402/g.33858  ORF Transcript_22402/g.33858 Transcript_22402/m.33858 type:complete len:1758 (-) Transcript_22402:89-5362(-)